MNVEASTEPSECTSLSLLKRLRANDPEAWRRLAKLYGPEVYRWARYAGLQDTDAADVVQEVFRSVACSIEQFHRENTDDSFRGWVWTITKNKIRDHFRAAQRRVAASGGSTAQVKIEQVVDQSWQTEQREDSTPSRSNLPRRALDFVRPEFTEQTWQAFSRVALEGQKPAHVAEDLGISVGAVYMAKSRVMRRLREELSSTFAIYASNPQW